MVELFKIELFVYSLLIANRFDVSIDSLICFSICSIHEQNVCFASLNTIEKLKAAIFTKCKKKKGWK